MQLRANFDEGAVVRPDDYEWSQSPANGVERMMLDRIGGEVARATTIVRFAPDTSFDAHEHGGGEEFLVLHGVFSDEHQDYPAGTYVRNPIGTSHTPHIGESGATILVKLHQFAPDDAAHFHVDTNEIAFAPGASEGVTEALLHEHATERVRMVRFEPGVQLPTHAHTGGEELFVLQGSFSDEAGHYPAGTWVRNPDGTSHAPRSDEGCLLWIKTGHLGKNVIGAT